MSHLYRAPLLLLLFLVPLSLAACEPPPADALGDAASAEPDATADTPDAGAPDATTIGAWTLERAADERSVRKLVVRGEVGFEQEILAVGQGALVEARQIGGAGGWTPLAPASLATLLEPFAAPRGDFNDAAYVSSSHGWIVAGGLGFYRGGVVRYGLAEGGSWGLELDEVRDLDGVTGGPVTSLMVLGNCAFCTTEYYAAFGGRLARRGVTLHDPWRVIGSPGTAAIAAIAVDPDTFGIVRGFGAAIYDFNENLAGWEESPIPLPRESDWLRAVWVGEEFIVAVGNDGLIRLRDEFIRQGEATFTAVHGTSASDVWVVGVAGTIVHFDGASWHSIDPPRAGIDFSAVVATPTMVWLGAEDGEIWRLAR